MRPPLRRPTDPSTTTEATEETSTASPEGRAIRCAACGHEITRTSARASIDGAHEHTFINAHGYVHQLACFREAPGCVNVGTPTLEWTWFVGYAWRFALCGGCARHVGWHYARGDDHFHGLIVTSIAEG